jgi:hypothetical protein
MQGVLKFKCKTPVPKERTNSKQRPATASPHLVPHKFWPFTKLYWVQRLAFCVRRRNSSLWALRKQDLQICFLQWQEQWSKYGCPLEQYFEGVYIGFLHIILGAFAKLLKATIRFIMSVRLYICVSVTLERLASACMEWTHSNSQALPVNVHISCALIHLSSRTLTNSRQFYILWKIEGLNYCFIQLCTAWW